MFETAELGRSVGKEEFEAEVPKLRLELLEAQRELQKAGVPVILLLAGADGAGKGETVKRVLEWLDARGLDTHAFGAPTDEERERPRWWRYWMRLPPAGPHGHLLRLLVHRASRRAGLRPPEPRPLRPDAVRDRLLRADARGGRGARRQALDPPLEEGSSQAPPPPRGRPRHALEGDEGRLEALRKYDRYIEASETPSGGPTRASRPWLLVEATDERYRDLMAGRTLLERFRSRLGAAAPPRRAAAPAGSPAPPPAMSGEASLTILDRVDLKKKLLPEAYERRLEKAQGRLGRLVRAAFEKKRSSVVVFEGWDASGKGGNIRGSPRPWTRALSGHLGGRPDRRGEGPPLSLALLGHVPRAG